MEEEKLADNDIVNMCIEHATNKVIERESRKGLEASTKKINFKFCKDGITCNEERTLLHLNDTNLAFYIKEYISRYKKLLSTDYIIVTIQNKHISNALNINALCKHIIFKQCSFDSLAECGYTAEFIECHIPADIKVINGYFRSCCVHGCCSQKELIAMDSKFTEIKLTSCPTFIAENCEVGILKLNGEKQLSSQARLYNVAFLSPIVNAHNISFASRNVDLNNIKFSCVNDTPSIAAFRCIKHACQEAEYEHGSILFHGYELEAHYNVYLKKNCPASRLPEKIGHWIHRGFTDYGRDIMRPFMCLAYLFILAGWISFAHYGLAPTDALLLSFKQSVGPMAFALNSDFWKELKLPDPDFIGFFHIITSSLIWFLIIFMIRRRFKI